MLIAETQQQAPFDGDANPVAGIAEIVTMRRDEANTRVAVRHPEVSGWTQSILGGRHQRITLLDGGFHIVAGIKGFATRVVGYIAERHLFDEADIHAFSTREIDQIQHLIVVTALEHDRIELDPLESCIACRADTCDDMLQVARARQLAEALGIERVEC